MGNQVNRRQRAALCSVVVCVLASGCETQRSAIDAIMYRQRSVLKQLPIEDKQRLVADDHEVTDTSAGTLLEPGVLELSRTRRIALRSNPDIHAARARLESAITRIDEAMSFFLPQVGLLHNSNRTFQTPSRRTRVTTPVPPLPEVPDLASPNLLDIFNFVQAASLGQGDFSTGNTQSFSDHATTLTTSWTIFDGFAREARLLGARHNYLASAMSLADAQRLIVKAVDAAYFQAQLGEEQVRVAMADEAFSRKQLDDARRRLAAQKITKADVLNFEVRVRAAQVDVVAAKGVRDTSRIVLAELMGIEGALLPADIQLEELDDETEALLTPPEVYAWIDMAMINRPDLAEADHVYDARAENVKLAEAQFRPELNFNASYGFERLSNLKYSEDDQASGVAVELRWQLYTGGFRTAQLRRAEAERWEALADRQSKKLEVASDVRNAAVDVVNAQEQLKLQRLNLESALENRRLVQTEYAAGKASLVRLNEAQRDFVGTDAELARARLRLRQVWSDLYAAANAYQAGEHGVEIEHPQSTPATQ